MRISGLRVLAAVGLVALALTACGNNPTTQQKLSGGTATFAEAPNAKPNYIFPLASGGFFSVANLSQFQFLMYRPLYWFGENGTVKLKGGKWSDGQPVTSRDIEFWMNLLKANVGHWAAYVPKEFPDNVVSMSFPDSMTSVFTLDKAYGSLFFTYNELSQISPLPQHVWDKTSASGSVGDFDRDPTQA